MTVHSLFSAEEMNNYSSVYLMYQERFSNVAIKYNDHDSTRAEQKDLHLPKRNYTNYKWTVAYQAKYLKFISKSNSN